MIKNILLIGLGGGIGSILRYLGQQLMYRLYPVHFPWGTFSVNVIGCFFIGLFWGMSFRSFDDNESWKLFLMTGLCGGFTTFSAFTLEGIDLLKEQKMAFFFMYIAASVLIGLAATYLGMKISR